MLQRAGGCWKPAIGYIESASELYRKPFTGLTIFGGPLSLKEWPLHL